MDSSWRQSPRSDDGGNAYYSTTTGTDAATCTWYLSRKSKAVKVPLARGCLHGRPPPTPTASSSVQNWRIGALWLRQSRRAESLRRLMFTRKSPNHTSTCMSHVPCSAWPLRQPASSQVGWRWRGSPFFFSNKLGMVPEGQIQGFPGGGASERPGPCLHRLQLEGP